MSLATLIANLTASAASNLTTSVARSSYLSLMSLSTNSATQETLPSAISGAILSLSENSAAASATTLSSILVTTVEAISTAQGSNGQASALAAASLSTLSGPNPTTSTTIIHSGGSPALGEPISESFTDTLNYDGSPTPFLVSHLVDAGTATVTAISKTLQTTHQSPSESGSLTLGGAIRPAVSSLSQTVLVFTTTLPSVMPALLSLIETHSGERSSVSAQTTTTAPPTSTSIDATAEIEVSIVAALTSAGVPPSAAESLGTVILGNSQKNGLANGDANLDHQQRITAIEAVMQWFMTFFHE